MAAGNPCSATGPVFSRATALLSVVVGAIVFVGWLLDIALLKSLLPGLGAMRANTAMAFMMLGGAFYLLSRERPTRGVRLIAHGLALFVCLSSALALGEVLFHWNLYLDEFLTIGLERVTGTALRGHMPVATALSFLLLSGSLLLLDKGHAYLLAQVMPMVAILLSLLAVTGYAYHVTSFELADLDHALAFHTIALFVSLACGLLAFRADRAIVKVVLSHNLGGVLARRLLPMAAGIPLAIGWLRLEGERRGLYGTDVGAALFALANVACFTWVILWSAASLHKTDTERLRAESESKQTELALRTSRAMLQGVLNLIPLGVFWKDRCSRYLGCNEIVCRALGFSDTGQIVGHTDKDMPSITPEQAEVFIAKDREVMAANSPQYHVFEQLTRSDGTTIWLDTNKVPMHDDQGRVSGVLGTWEDITQRKQAEEAIESYNERLRILHQIDSALIAGDEPAAIAAAALPLLRDLLGVRRVVVNLFDLVANEVEWLAAAGPRRIRVGPGIRYSLEFMGNVAALQRGELQFIDVAALPPGAEVAALLASGVHSYGVIPMIAKGELIGALSFGGTSTPLSTEQISIAQEAAAQFAIAITQARLHDKIKRQAQELEVRVRERTQELEEAHAQLQQTNAALLKLTAELQAANKELEAFSYSVSHDLRAPLRAIDGFSRIMLEDYAPQLPDEARSYLQDVRANTLQMGRLVDDLLAFSRLSRQPVQRQTVDAAQLVQQCLDELQEVRQGRRVEIRVDALPGCQADPALLKQVWLNLLANALKYTGKRDAAVLEIGCQSHAGRPVYFVKDNGVGFDMRYAHKLFGVFQRLHRAEDYEGTGVGLAIVQRIIHRHGGEVWAEAKSDQGAIFFFTLGSGGLCDAQP